MHWRTPRAVAFSLRLASLTVTVITYSINHLLLNAYFLILNMIKNENLEV